MLNSVYNTSKLCHSVIKWRMLVVSTHSICSTNTLSLDQKWRREKGLPENPNTFHRLANRPDFSYLDGRPSPIGVKHSKRIIKQMEYAAKIVQLTNEIDFAVERHERLQNEAELTKRQIISSKLKPKGNLLDKNNIDKSFHSRRK